MPEWYWGIRIWWVKRRFCRLGKEMNWYMDRLQAQTKERLDSYGWLPRLDMPPGEDPRFSMPSVEWDPYLRWDDLDE